MEESPEKYTWNRTFVHVRKNLEELEPEIDEQSTSDEPARASKSQPPALIYSGYWRLNMELPPADQPLGWIMGKGRWKKREGHPSSITSSGVDILLAANAKESSLRGRHARLFHSLESFALLVAAEQRLRVGERYLDSTKVAAIGQRKTTIAFGDMEYELSFTNINQSLYRAQLVEHSQFLEYQGHQPGILWDPTPADTDYTIMNKYTIRRSFAKGSTCWMCAAVDKDTGASVAVKKIDAMASNALNNARLEINAMKRLSVAHCPVSFSSLSKKLRHCSAYNIQLLYSFSSMFQDA